MKEIKLLPREFTLFKYKHSEGRSSGLKDACAEILKISSYYEKTISEADISEDDKKSKEEWLKVFESIAKSIEARANELEKESQRLLQEAINMWPSDRTPCLCQRLKNAMIGFRTGWSKEA